MHWIDHLNAILVGSVVLMMSIGAYVLMGEGSREDVQVSAGTSFRESLVSQIEIDFENLGAGLLAGETAVLSHDSTHVRFRSVIDQAGSLGIVEYRIVPADVEDGVQLYRLDRFANGVATGGSAPRLVTFDLTFRNDAGATVPATSAAMRAVDVWVQWSLGLGGNTARDVRHASWGSTIHPAPLRFGS